MLNPDINRWVYGRLIYPAVVGVLGERVLFRRLRELEQLQWCDTGAIAALQERRLAALLSHAARQTEYYRPLLPSSGNILRETARDALSSMPMLTKADVQSRAADLTATPRVGRITHKTTGGSTGQAVTIAKDRVALAYERAAMWLGYGWAGIRFGDRCARFWGSQFNGRRRAIGQAGDFAMNRLRFSAFAFDDADLERYWRRCVAFQPGYLYGYVSMLEAFASFVESRGYDGRTIGARAVITTSEVLSPPQRALLARVFGAPVSVEYGCGEVGPIAYECEVNSLHLMSADLIVEVVDESGHPVSSAQGGQIVLTDLNSRAMPLIRYRIGDNGVVGPPCACGRGFPTLAKIWGRAYDVVEGTDGRRYHGEFFMYVFEDLRKEGHPLRQFQVVQTARDHILLRVVADSAGLTAATPILLEKLRTQLPGMRFSVQAVDAIEKSPSGKSQVVQNLVLVAPALPPEQPSLMRDR